MARPSFGRHTIHHHHHHHCHRHHHCHHCHRQHCPAAAPMTSRPRFGSTLSRGKTDVRQSSTFSVEQLNPRAMWYRRIIVRGASYTLQGNEQYFEVTDHVQLKRTDCMHGVIRGVGGLNAAGSLTTSRCYPPPPTRATGARASVSGGRSARERRVVINKSAL